MCPQTPDGDALLSKVIKSRGSENNLLRCKCLPESCLRKSLPKSIKEVVIRSFLLSVLRARSFVTALVHKEAGNNETENLQYDALKPASIKQSRSLVTEQARTPS